jgi:hypothetical protein
MEIVLFTTNYLSSLGNYIGTGHQAHIYILKGDNTSGYLKKISEFLKGYPKVGETTIENNFLHISEALLHGAEELNVNKVNIINVISDIYKVFQWKGKPPLNSETNHKYYLNKTNLFSCNYTYVHKIQLHASNYNVKIYLQSGE